MIVVLLAFNSHHHPVAHKAAVVRTLMDWAYRLSSNLRERTVEERRVGEALQKNGQSQLRNLCKGIVY